MAKFAPDAFYDASLDTVKNATTRICVCSTQPTTYTEAITTYNLGISDHASSTPNTALTSADFTGPAADTSGRKLDVNARAGIYVATTGSAQHVALVSGAALLYVTTCTTQAVTSGNKVDLPAWEINVQAPA